MNHEQCKGCLYDYAGQKGCRIFTVRPMDWDSPVECWNHTKDVTKSIDEPLPPEAFPESVREVVGGKRTS